MFYTSARTITSCSQAHRKSNRQETACHTPRTGDFSGRSLVNTLYLLILSLLTTPLWAGGDQPLPLETQAKIIVKRFGGALKPQLREALQSGGPSHAIEVCSTRAPAIAAQLSAETGWQVKRVSLKPRNPDAQSDPWETQTLKAFEKRLSQGQAASELHHAATTAGEFRYMQAIAVAPACLACHGEQLAPEVQQQLQRHYPQDQATGYSVGDIRGAFSLSKPLP